MNIGIILYSYTGNTLSVGEKLKEALISKGHQVQLERIKALKEDPNSREPIQLTESPDITKYDQVIFGAPVQAFSLNPIMKVYLTEIQDLSSKKISCFVTEHFPKSWMGGNHAIKQMSRDIQQKNGVVIKKGVVNWTSKKREAQINDILLKFCSQDWEGVNKSK